MQDGWNVTGDTYIRTPTAISGYQARSDDMIVPPGYNIAGPEVETALMTHPAVRECGVVGAPDADRGQVVKAYVVLADGFTPDAALVKALQDHVKAEISPYKYPRLVEFVSRPAAHRHGQAEAGRAARDRRIRFAPDTLKAAFAAGDDTCVSFASGAARQASISHC